jgi:hypothetical protein
MNWRGRKIWMSSMFLLKTPHKQTKEEGQGIMISALKTKRSGQKRSH